jgi:quercetin dioxygenase-like cupin family protein
VKKQITTTPTYNVHQKTADLIMKAGNIFENPVTGEYGYIRIGTEETNGELLVADLRIRPGGAISGEHFHRTITERFTVVSGKIGYKLGGKTGVAQAGATLELPVGIPHDWWNAGTEEARVIVQIRPAARFVQMVTTLFGLAKEGKTNEKGMPNLLQLAVISDEFKDVIQFVKPPVWVQSLLFGLLAPLGRLLGYRVTYPQHQLDTQSVEVEPLPEGVTVAARSPSGAQRGAPEGSPHRSFDEYAAVTLSCSVGSDVSSHRERFLIDG